MLILLMQEKKALKEEKLKQEEKYMWAMLDGVKEKVTLFFDSFGWGWGVIIGYLGLLCFA